ncbi:hypothetical protein PHLGIDRAFT_119846 [Phlebiopsis gigantea 11061_1 CR5-6]|uniref:Uncharacterized protein n=1 Tax=Phlebiopsis gigantea (strain 11061_1 CR5-6) TaxID=745531 RepID=A0A0C3RVP5_PHLG1|nr:hypothetical protein PHLGIDRAFT_119846 [Phlebiopsis gigantea 11061_1 CR5-6]
MPPPSFMPWNVYASELVRLGYGHPLYYPEPTHLGEVEIGDVGIVQEGRFFRLFNATRETDDPAHARGVPARFVRLLVDDRLRCRLANCLPKGPVCSQSTSRLHVKAALSLGPTPTSVQGSGGKSFTVDRKQGAVAVLNDCGVQEKIMQSCIAFEEYILTHSPSWAEFAQQRGLRLRSQDIVLVSGWIKTTEWALSAYVGDSRSHELSFSIAAGGYASADCAFTVEKSTGTTMAERQGPRPPPSHPRADQCMFLRYYKCGYRTSSLIRRRQPALLEEAEHMYHNNDIFKEVKTAWKNTAS